MKAKENKQINITNNQVRFIINEIMRDFILIDKYTFQKHIQLFNGRNIQLGRTTGTQIGTDTDQKLAFFGTTPVTQPVTVSDPVGQANDLDSEARTAIIALIDRLQELGLIA